MTEKLFKNDPPPPPAQSPTWSAGDSLGVKVEKLFIRVLQGVVSWGWSFFAEMSVHIFDASMKIMRPGLERVTKDIFAHIRTIPEMPQWFKDVMIAAEKETGESSFLIRLAVFYVSIRSLIFGGMSPLQRLAEYNSDKSARSFLPDAVTSSMFLRIGLMSEQGFQSTMEKLGLAEPLIPLYKEISRNLPTTNEAIMGVWRGVLTDAEFTTLLKRMGYDDKTAAIFKELQFQIPPISDLIRFQVREAFNEQTVQKFGYDDDYPSDLDPFIKKQGYAADWGKRYWRSHWTLPSPSQAYEMLHRGRITKGDLSELLKTADYPSFWRGHLEAISFNVLTRIDVRRLLQSGLIDRARALKAYTEMGYQPEDAELLTKFAEQGISNEERDLTRADVVSMYEDGLLDHGALSGALVKMGYDSVEADQIIKQADFNISKAARVDAINYVKEQYLAKKINRIKAQSDLAGAGLTDKSFNRYLLAWDRQIENDVKGLTLADARRMLTKGILSEEEFRAELKGMNVKDSAIALYILEIQGDQSKAQNAA